LQDIEQVDVASMDGPRVSQFIQTQIKYDHIPIFQRSLQCIKHWATARQIYNKPVGYLNGSSWTFLLLKTYLIVKNIEQLSVTYLLTTFFDTWMDWSWSAPVLLTEHIPGLNGIRVDYQKLEEFQDAIMPIVSPCYPVSLATPYVTKSTLKIMTREFERGTQSTCTLKVFIILNQHSFIYYAFKSKAFQDPSETIQSYQLL
jgi:poly(A) polymerase